MRDQYPPGLTLSTNCVHAVDAQDSSSLSNRALRSVASASMQVGHLVRQAMLLIETDRTAAWRCLSDASTLLGADIRDSEVNGQIIPDKLRPRSLANWQAKRALAYIEANLGSKIALEDLANVVALSRSHFSHAFKDSLGSPPMVYVAMRRVQRAKAMLTSSRESLAEIALTCGFADQSHFNRRFRDAVGIGPGRWRRTHGDVPEQGRGVEPRASHRQYEMQHLMRYSVIQLNKESRQ